MERKKFLSTFHRVPFTPIPTPSFHSFFVPNVSSPLEPVPQ